jgi:hypothetical protein
MSKEYLMLKIKYKNGALETLKVREAFFDNYHIDIKSSEKVIRIGESNQKVDGFLIFAKDISSFEVLYD